MLHIWGHQDTTTADLTSLPLSAPLNIVADDGTHQAYKNHPHFHQTPPLPSTHATLILNGSRVTFKMTTHASLVYYRPIMADFFQHKFGWDNITFSNIDWDSSEKRVLLPLPRPLPGIFQTSEWLVANEQDPTPMQTCTIPLCSWCNLHPETHNHVLCSEQAQPIGLQQ